MRFDLEDLLSHRINFFSLDSDPDDEDYDPNNDEILTSSQEDCILDLTESAKKHTKAFFRDKEHHIGGPVPSSVLMDKDNINLLFIEFQSALKIAKYIPTENIMEVLDECATRKIPKYFAGGILLLYFNLCKGHDFEN